jgi:catechol 2,3-dioxygenase-like lactoylglutathione lyase family enzyme
MLNTSPVMAFVATANAPRAIEFYRDTLGLKFIADEPYAVVFDANGTMLRVQKVEALMPAWHTVLGWRVTDIAATVRGLSAKGVAFERYGFLPQDDLGIWSAPGGARVAWFKDPDGNTLSLTQWD